MVMGNLNMVELCLRFIPFYSKLSVMGTSCIIV
jgi:hypothetical protein